jgi:hypothetical protein
MKRPWSLLEISLINFHFADWIDYEEKEEKKNYLIIISKEKLSGLKGKESFNDGLFFFCLNDPPRYDKRTKKKMLKKIN